MTDHLKIPLNQSLGAFAQKKIDDAIQQTGKGLPCTVVKVAGSIVTVKFEIISGFTLPQITIPLFGPIYIRYPIQVGDKGITIPADAYLGGISGLGGGTAGLTQRSNLSALVFLPISNTGWSSVDPNSVNVNGPNGVVLRDTATACTFVLTPTTITATAPNSVTLICGTSEIQITPTSYTIKGTTGSISDGSHTTSAALMNSVWNLLTTFLNTHTHTGVQSGSSSSGAATTPYSGGNIAP